MGIGEQIEKMMGAFSGFVWGVPLLVLLVGTHLFLTIRLGFIQRFIGRMIGVSVEKDPDAKGDVSQFGALVTALAATIGTGNIFGVASAVAAGGPGAIFWMWITGVLGIATKYSEALLAVKYRVETPRGMAGGPMYVLERGMHQKWLGIVFALFTCIAAFGIGNMTQANTIIALSKSNLPQIDGGLLAQGLGLGMAALTAVVILGGVRWIANVCTVLVPFMAVFYVAGCVLVLIKNAALIPGAVGTIMETAFTGQAAVGGFLGATIKEAMRFGVARGLFSNESGLGSAPIVAAAARTRNPVRQAMASATGTFWDTVVICAMTGLVLVTSGHWQEGLERDQLTRAAFADLHVIGPWVLNIGLATFVFSTILGWSYYGEKAAEYLFGPRAVLPYRVLWVVAVYFGSVATMKAVWDFADAMNGLMAVPNLISLIVLSGVIVAETRKYRHEFKPDKKPGGAP
jgi:AGCS family alanine or glycine:cation symporter